jgi:hypothetical protein
MANYYSPTVVQQTIPNTDMTPLEQLLLCHVFEANPDGDGLYFHSWEGPSDMIWVNRSELEAALAASRTADSAMNAWVAEQLKELAGGDDNAEQDHIDLDLSDIWWPSIFQDIVKRSSTLRYVTATMSFTCSKMRSDGFGGMAIFVTADAIKSQSTNEFLECCISEIETKADDGNPAVLPSSKQSEGEASDAKDH